MPWKPNSFCRFLVMYLWKVVGTWAPYAHTRAQSAQEHLLGQPENQGKIDTKATLTQVRFVPYTLQEHGNWDSLVLTRDLFEWCCSLIDTHW